MLDISPQPHAAGSCNGTVLIVDDEVPLARMYARVLTAGGYRVLSAGDGPSAEAMFRADTVDAVVSDVMMPGMDGRELLRALHRIDGDVPIILATGDQTADGARAAVHYGAHMYLQKPVDLRALTQIVHHAVETRRRLRASPANRRRGDAPDATLAARFEQALQKLWMAYQPIVMWATMAPVGFEALVRSDEPTLGIPAALFDAADKLGRTLDLGRAIRARIAGELPGAHGDLRIFVNLAPEDLDDETLYDARNPLLPHAERIVLEITERTRLERIGNLAAPVERLRAAGFRLAVDDLGAGYAGLSSLAKLRPDVVKLDASLIQDIDKSALQRRLVQSMAMLCRDSGIELIGEGVETEQQREALGFAGCQYHQGFFYARPRRGLAGPLAGPAPWALPL